MFGTGSSERALPKKVDMLPQGTMWGQKFITHARKELDMLTAPLGSLDGKGRPGTAGGTAQHPLSSPTRAGGGRRPGSSGRTRAPAPPTQAAVSSSLALSASTGTRVGSRVVGWPHPFAENTGPHGVPKLTHRKVPRGVDYDRQYCSACQFEDVDRCAFCVNSKLSVVPRLHLGRLGSLLIEAQPEVCAKELLDIVTRYSLSDAYAAEINLKLGWPAEPRALCGPHQATVDQYQLQIDRLKVQVKLLRREKAEAEAKIDESREQAAKAHFALHLSRLDMKRKDGELDAMRKALGSFQEDDRADLVGRSDQLEETLRGADRRNARLAKEIRELRSALARADQNAQALRMRSLAARMSTNAPVGVGVGTAASVGGVADQEGGAGDEEEQKGIIASLVAAIGDLDHRLDDMAGTSELVDSMDALDDNMDYFFTKWRAHSSLRHEAGRIEMVDATTQINGNSGATSQLWSSALANVSPQEAREPGEPLVKARKKKASAVAKRAVKEHRHHKVHKNQLSKYSVQKGKLLKSKMPMKAADTFLLEIYEKKAIADSVDDRDSVSRSPFPEFFEQYFMQKFGLKSLAKKKCQEMVSALLAYKNENFRFYCFSLLAGFEESEFYTPMHCDVFLDLLRRLYPQHDCIREKLDNGIGKCLVSKQAATAALISKGGQQGDETTWEPSLLLKVSTLSGFKHLLSRVQEMEDMDEGTHEDMVDVDLFLEMVVDFYMEQLKQRDEEIQAAFDQFDADQSGDIRKDEFLAAMAHFTRGRYTDREIEALYVEVQEYDEDNDGVMDIDPGDFSKICRKHQIYLKGENEVLNLADQKSVVEVEMKNLREMLQRVHGKVMGRTGQDEADKVHDQLLFDTVRDALGEIDAVARR